MTSVSKKALAKSGIKELAVVQSKPLKFEKGTLANANLKRIDISASPKTPLKNAFKTSNKKALEVKTVVISKELSETEMDKITKQLIKAGIKRSNIIKK